MRFRDDERKRLVTPSRVAALMGVMLLWGMVSAPSSIGVEEDIVEPTDLVAYATTGDARPLQTWFDHQVYQIPLGPSLARSQTEVSMPSNASGLAWLVEAGLANGIHGTTTGNRVPTEASAKQPGGATDEEFRVAGGPIGDDDFMRVGAGVAGARAERDDTPRSYAYSHFDNLILLPAPGAEEYPPGTFDPDATFPGDEDLAPERDPQPRGQMAVLSIGSMASTSESFRNGSSVTSVAVTELKDINIGNRTSDNRCTNCIRIDSIRAEAFAEANGQEDGSRGRYRVVMGRACRRAVTSTQQGDEIDQREVDTCIQPATASNFVPQDTRTPSLVGPPEESERIERFDEVTKFFEQRAWNVIDIPGPDLLYVGVRVHAGTPHEDADRANRGGNPPEDTRRNYGYPDQRLNEEDRQDPAQERKFEDKPIPHSKQQEPDRDKGTRATASAEALDLEITTLTVTKALPSDQQIGEASEGVADEVDEDPNTPGIQITVPNPDCGEDQKCVPPVGTPRIGGQAVQAWPLGRVTIGVETIRTLRRINLTLGVAQASTTVRPTVVLPPTGGGSPPPTGGTGSPDGGTAPPPVQIPGGGAPPTIPGTGSGGGPVVVGGGGLQGPLKVRFDWSGFRLKPWAAGDQAKGFLSGGIIGGAWFLAKRRLKLFS